MSKAKSTNPAPDYLTLTELYEDFDNVLDALAEDINSVKAIIFEAVNAGAELESMTKVLEPYVDDLTRLYALKCPDTKTKQSKNKKP